MTRADRKFIVHAIYPNGFTTLCEKDTTRVPYTREPENVTCPACLKIMNGENAHGAA